MKIALTDDEPLYRDYLDEHIRQEAERLHISDLHIDHFQSGEEFLERWQAGVYQLIILDIFMDALDGMEVARRIREKDNRAEIVFCTTSNDFAMQSYEVDACYYLHKPFQESDLARMMERVNLKRLEAKRTVELPDGHTCLMNSITYIDYIRHKVILHFQSEEDYSIRMALKELEDMLLDNDMFCKVNRSNIVNFNMVKRYTRESLTMMDGTELDIARGRMNEVADQYAAFRLKKLDI